MIDIIKFVLFGFVILINIMIYYIYDLILNQFRALTKVSNDA